MTEKKMLEHRVVMFRRDAMACSLWAAFCVMCAGFFLARGEFVGWLSLASGVFCAFVASGAIHFHAVCTELLERKVESDR